MTPPSLSREARIVARIKAIPERFVSTYGDIDPIAPRLVGRLLATSHHDLPWHRVVRADGSLPMGPPQLQLLREEGVPLRGDRVDLARARTATGDWHSTPNRPAGEKKQHP
jgi:alkylated DNA nucleotide flippase Atl1